jgi:hypothetical protein
MRPPRLRLRTLLIAVAVAGMVLGEGLMIQRRARLRATSARHAAQEQMWTTLAAAAGQRPSRRVDWSYRGVRRQTDQGRCRAAADYHARLARKYDRAARYPWLPVAPDPPPPQPE